LPQVVNVLAELPQNCPQVLPQKSMLLIDRDIDVIAIPIGTPLSLHDKHEGF